MKINAIFEYDESLRRIHTYFFLNYFKWDELIVSSLCSYLDKNGEFKTQSNSHIIQRIFESHFSFKFRPWKSIKVFAQKKQFDTLMDAMIHLKYFSNGNENKIIKEKILEEKLCFSETRQLGRIRKDKKARTKFFSKFKWKPYCSYIY